MVASAKPPIVIDLDGTLVESAWPQLGEWMPGAVDALQQLRKVARVIIFTSRIAPVQPDGKTKRSPAEVQMEVNRIRNMLDDQNLYDVEIHQDAWKPAGYAYVDNLAVRYAGKPGSWKAILPKLINMSGHYEEAVASDSAL